METLINNNSLVECPIQTILTTWTMTIGLQVEDPLVAPQEDPLADLQEDHQTTTTLGYLICLTDHMEHQEEEEDPLAEDHQAEAHQEDPSLKIPLQTDNLLMLKEQMTVLSSRKRSRSPTHPNGMVTAILYWIGLISSII